MKLAICKIIAIIIHLSRVLKNIANSKVAKQFHPLNFSQIELKMLLYEMF